MGAFKLELRCPQRVNEVGVDPNPDWSFDSLLSELSSLENKLNNSSSAPFTKTLSRQIVNRRSRRAFVMRVSDDEVEDNDSEGDDEKDHTQSLVVAKRFNYDDIHLCDSDDSDYENDLDSYSYLMEKVGLVESSLFELSQEHQLGVKEEIRNQISALEMELMRESEKSNSAFNRVEKYREARKESDRKFDTQYQRKIAEALDNHLTSIQRDHELKSQIEERKIRSDAAHEEARRKEKALQEERLRQERARAEAEAKRKAEEAKMAALEAERKAAKEAAEKEAAEASKKQAATVSGEDVAGNRVHASSANWDVNSQGAVSNGTNKSQLAGSIIRAAESALSLEQKRLEKLRALEEQNRSLKLSSNMDFSSHERHVARLIKQIRGTKENVRAKSSELVKLCQNPSCPQSISIAAIATFPKKVASQSELPDSAVFACAYVIVMVTSQVPHSMNLLLAEFHRGCIYTVPRHVTYSKSAFESKEAYQKTIGYQEQNGKIESTTDYLKRLECYMRLYGALVQTEVQGFQNSHGPNEGWAWLARFLNNLPANIYTAVALNGFLKTAGFVLFRKYRSQFGKMLNIIYNDFLEALRKRQDSGLNATVAEIQSYIQDKKFLQEPEGARLQGSLVSHVIGGQPEFR
ncbi:mRNA export factor GLE1 isoform X2 [Ricinus communis]|uniref:mRNA export factor GLE1 isoform X2 n=1 Tax=Ricinus communis TaxID=3988 RepID=UPI00201ACE8D|nr:mRNA export factor GLE1 isoform X2 [Ricinus communis]